MRIALALACALFCSLNCSPAFAHDPNSPSADTFAVLAKSVAHLRASDLPALTERANDGNPRAQMLLAIAYRDGAIIPRDYDKYVQLLTSAATHGYAAAQTELGSNFVVNGDRQQAIAWFEKAIAQGDADAQFNLALLYAKGEAETSPDVGQKPRPDMHRAVALFQKAAAQGYAQAEYIVGLAYRDGLDVAVDAAKSRQWIQASADHGFSKAQFSLGASYYLATDYKNSLIWFLRAADQKHPRAELNVAAMYYRGEGTPNDMEQAQFWYRRAAEHGEPAALRMIGTMYANGYGVDKDMVACYAYMQAASDSGDQQASRDMAEFAAALTKEQITEASRRAAELVLQTKASQTKISQTKTSQNPKLSAEGTLPTAQP